MADPIAVLRIPTPPVAHGFRPVNDRAGHAHIARGHTPEHADQLDTYQALVQAVARRWLLDHDGVWPHYDAPIALGAALTIPRPTTYRQREHWHRTNRPGDLTTLTRAVEDALTGVLYRDDAQVAVQLAGKPLTVDRHEPGFAVVVVASADQASDVLDTTADWLRIHRHQRTETGRPG